MRRSLFALATIGFGLVVATIISGYATGRDTGIHLGWYGRLAGYLISLALDVGLFVIAFRMLTKRDVTSAKSSRARCSPASPFSSCS